MLDRKITQRKRRHTRIRKKVGLGTKPRLIVFRSLKYIYVQMIDDANHTTIASASDIGMKGKKTKKEKAREVGKMVAEAALKKNVKECLFDRAGYKYHGRVKELAEGAREAGLKF